MKNNDKNNNDNNNKVTIYGTISSAYKGANKYSDKEAFRVSIKFNDGEREKLVKACDEMKSFDKTSEGFRPAWYTGKKTEYINIKSNYDFPVLGEANGCTSFADLLADTGNINGSEVGVSLKIKDGALYPVALKVYALKSTDFEELFDEDLPF